MSIYSDNFANHVRIVDDFLNVSGDTIWVGGTTTAECISYGESGHPGISRFHLGTGAQPFFFLRKATGSFSFGYGDILLKSLVRYPSTGISGSQNYVVLHGLIDLPNVFPPTQGAFFEYNTTGAGNSIVAVTSLNTIQTRTITSVSINTGTWYDMTINGNAVGDKVDFYINKQLVASHNTNIPTGNAFFGPAYTIARTVGNNDINVLDLDLMVLNLKNNNNNTF